MSLRSDNGWSTLGKNSSLLRDWVVGPIVFRGRSGPAGFILTHLAQWFHEEIERLDLQDMPWDDHMYGARFIGGGTSGVPSNHWSATAVDLNAMRHRQGDPPLVSFTPIQVKRIRTKLEDKYAGVIWGGDWNAVDSMHFELDEIERFTKDEVRALALELVPTPVGKRLIAAQAQPVLWQTW